MLTQSDTARREVELTNVPVVVAQAERFRQRLGYWSERVESLKLNAKADLAESHSRSLHMEPATTAKA
jgi:hypothetical protein